MASDSLSSKFSLEFNSGIPVYRQIINQVYALIAEGTVAEGDRLPTIRQLTETLGVNANTVAKAFRELELQGAIRCQRGSGAFVAPSPALPRVPEKERDSRLNTLYESLVAEASRMGVSPDELREFLLKSVPEVR